MDALTRLFNKAAIIEREPADTGDGVLLYTSEVHLIDMAGRFPEESMSSLAVRMGITKGAISQTTKKLEEKGYLERINQEGNNKTVFIRLTDSGKRAYDWHQAYHALVNERIIREISGLDNRDRENIRKFFLEIEKIFDDCPETRRGITDSIAGGCQKKT
ncbi:MAG: winged helix DNA-binding protein [Methanoregula sp.]|jgi:DNA-binding MarR family transcriptional regulator|uniref:MarR family winged helix-turn-helix transcriptional regulator n=1 Tax=Methanoregula sp. TaxID=2052170 RepID=UPI0025E99807|nr:winged helix DNA-binding protein [Methanoregula sp.]MCK9631255.1 winged helix DNA-binding protein [Methanoregula sp.]